jgi:hypothetical protein
VACQVHTCGSAATPEQREQRILKAGVCSKTMQYNALRATN